LRIDGNYEDRFSEGNPLVLQMCSNNDIQFVQDVIITFGLEEGTSRVSDCMCGTGSAERNLYGLDARTCCPYFGYTKEFWLGNCYGCVDFDVPQNVQINHRGTTLLTISKSNPSATYNFNNIFNNEFYNEIVTNIRSNDIVSYDRCFELQLQSSDEYGRVTVPDRPAVTYVTDPCNNLRYYNDYCDTSIDTPETDSTQDTVGELQLNLYKVIGIIFIFVILFVMVSKKRRKR